jgi:outer membrane cobalamin receptor
MKIRYCFILLLTLLFSTSPLFAGTTGKISGIVRDADNGEPLPGANVFLEGTSLGASTDNDGFYYVLNIPPGTYVVQATYIGYGSSTKSEVRVTTDMTTKLDFELMSELLETETVVVTAVRPAIQKDLTSSQQSFDAGEISESPVINLGQLISTQAGVNAAASVERASIVLDAPGDGLHIRGGRENETAFLVDGVRVDNPMWGGANYSQNTSGSGVTEMMTILGTFNAEYGGKTSGVINLVTKEGTKRISGKVSGFTDKFGIAEFDRNTFQGELTLSGPIPIVSNMKFFVNGQAMTTDGRFSAYIIPNWTDYNGQIPIEDENGNPVGEEVSVDWKDEWNALMKMSWRIGSSLNFMASYVIAHVKKQKYYHDYKYLPYGMPWSDTKTDGITLKLTHQLSSSTFYDLTASYQSMDYWLGVHKIREQRIVMGSRLSEEINGFYYSGAYQNYWADTTRTYQLKFNVTSQITNKHLLKVGVDLRYLKLFHRLDNAWTTPVDEIVVGVDEDGNQIKESAENHKSYANSDPWEWAVYFQDKMEFESLGMILNLGLRWERWSINENYMQNPNLPMETPLITTDPKIRLSPRVGVSYPVSDKAAFHFAYGHFYQLPSYVNMLSGINENGRFPNRPNLQDVGLAIYNPNIRPEKSVTYEAGIQTQLMRNVTLNVTAFYREMADLIGVTWIQTAGYVYFDNVDFGNSKGLEFTLIKSFSNYLSGRINYTLSQTLISTSSPMTAAQTVSSTPIAYKSYLADWDRTHELSALVRVADPQSWAVSVNASLRSGRPYTVMAEQPNTERMPTIINFDLRLSKYFNFLGMHETIYLQIFNLFNRQNIYWVYPITGKWDDDGDPGTPYAHDANPRRISDSRRINIGFNINF